MWNLTWRQAWAVGGVSEDKKWQMLLGGFACIYLS